MEYQWFPFCNIRLSLLSEHTKKYGHYGIGLNDDWASKKQFKPCIIHE
ncbi:hypothetical protein CHD15_09570 [Salmonella enterica]|nr:hypothetical protein CHD15_09570 [Salmonella enterica]